MNKWKQAKNQAKINAHKRMQIQKHLGWWAYIKAVFREVKQSADEMDEVETQEDTPLR